MTPTARLPNEGKLVFAPCNTPTTLINTRQCQISTGYSTSNTSLNSPNLSTPSTLYHGSPNSSLTPSPSNSYIHNVSDLMNQSAAGGSFLSGSLGGSVMGSGFSPVVTGYSPYTVQLSNSGARYRVSWILFSRMVLY